MRISLLVGLRAHVVAVVVALAPTSVALAADWVSEHARPGSFPLASAHALAPLVYDRADFAVTAISVRDLAADIERVTGRRPSVETSVAGVADAIVVIGTLGKSPAIDALVEQGKLDVRALRGQWETFLIAHVARPMRGVKMALVIVGSDRRGTAFGVYELSRAIGVSPWYWWADVAVPRRSTLYVDAGVRLFGPPSVKYRGLFLNDEDWGLQPWAAKTFEPDHGDIGPKTYAKVFELMLRLKANTLWPAMHPSTRAFNFHPGNKRVADDYAIVMGSSHAEPMLRNNVGEWKEPEAAYNYVTNRDGVRKYWEQRVIENGRFENIYTLGMRGIHDSAIQGARTDAERVDVLEQVFADQRALLATHVQPDVGNVPQMFCAYKEVLDLYRHGLSVPDDVTIVWPDDNFGYVRSYAGEAERGRRGGFGVYYHLSYLGAPLAYLWLYTTPPALVWEEMSKAYEHGARRIWIANVGDLKPAEVGIEFFLQMAWNIDRWGRDTLQNFLIEWATREFGAEHAHEIASVMARFYQLNYQRKPEHLQWWLPGEPVRPSALTDAEIAERLAAFSKLRARVARLRRELEKQHQDAFYQLVYYPVSGAALANIRYLQGERAAVAAGRRALHLAAEARAADVQLKRETHHYNEEIAGGKWRGIMTLEPADEQWKNMRIAAWKVPRFVEPKAAASECSRIIAVEAEHFSAKTDRGGTGWERIPGLGHTGDAVAIFPTTMPSRAADSLAREAPRMDYDLEFEDVGMFSIQVKLIPTHPIRVGRGLRFGLGLDDEPPREVMVDVRDGSREWAQNVLGATVVATIDINVRAAGQHTLRIYGVDAGVVLDKIIIGRNRCLESGRPAGAR